jgi:putative acetyltransferase
VNASIEALFEPSYKKNESCIQKRQHNETKQITIMNFYQRAGSLAFGSYLRRLGEMMYQWSVQVYTLYDLALDPRFFPVFQAIIWLKGAGVAEIAAYVGLTHAAVSQTLKELATQGYITLAKNSADKRQTTIKLTAKGKREQTQLETLLRDLDGAMSEAFAECATSPLVALQDYQQAMERSNLFERVQQWRKRTMAQNVVITELAARTAKPTNAARLHRNKQLEAFQQLNYEWIEQHFRVEESDRKALDTAETHIIKQGGIILFAEHNDTILGCVALIPHAHKHKNEHEQEQPPAFHTLELAKMAVSSAARGQSVGFLLGSAAVEKARAMGAARLYLESNTALVPAINLYYKLGFQRVANFTSPYERANIAMELVL